MKQTRSRMNLQAISELAELADYSFAFAIRAVAAIGVADHLEDGPKHIDKLAELTGSHPGSLLRLMRAMVTKSVFEEVEAGVFDLSAVGDLLRTDHPYSMRWFFRLEPDVQALAGLEQSVKSGKPCFEDIFGLEYFEWLAANELPRYRFRESQKALSRLELLTIARGYPWHEVGTMVDVGGNDGSMVASLLKRNPSLIATVFDLPDTVPVASQTFKREGVEDRASVVPGSLFEGGVPRNADLYCIKRVLVGFSDEETITALTFIREAMNKNSRLLIMEPMSGSVDQVGVSLDLLMLVLGLGKIRTPDEFTGLAEKSGLKHVRTQSMGLITILEYGVA